MDSSLRLIKGDRYVRRGVPLQSYIPALEVELVGSGPSWMIRWAGLPHIAWSFGDTLVIGFCPAADGPLSP